MAPPLAAPEPSSISAARKISSFGSWIIGTFRYQVLTLINETPLPPWQPDIAERQRAGAMMARLA